MLPSFTHWPDSYSFNAIINRACLVAPGLCYANLLKLIHLRRPALLQARATRRVMTLISWRGFDVTQRAQAYYPPALIYLIYTTRCLTRELLLLRCLAKNKWKWSYSFIFAVCLFPFAAHEICPGVQRWRARSSFCRGFYGPANAAVRGETGLMFFTFKNQKLINI